MKVYSTSYFRVYHKDFEGNWDYLISETPLNFGAIEGLLLLNYKERIQILEIIERSKGIVAIDLGGELYGFEYVFIAQEEGQHHYRLLDAKFEDISSSEIEVIKPKKNNNIANKFIKKAADKHLAETGEEANYWDYIKNCRKKED